MTEARHSSGSCSRRGRSHRWADLRGPRLRCVRASRAARRRYSRTTLVETDEQRAADQGVADRHLVEVRQRAEQHEVVEIEIVPGVDAEAERVRERRGRRRSRAKLAPPASWPARTRARTARCTARRGRRRSTRPTAPPPRRVDEQADADPAACRSADDRGQLLAVGVSGRPAGLARHLARRDRHQRALIGPHLAHQLEQLGPRIAFDVELDRRAERASDTPRSSRTSSGVMCRASARGCTVIPAAPAADADVRPPRARSAARPPRELRSVATLLTLTLSVGIEGLSWLIRDAP